jgi:parallel beta-helix repeat protein
MKSKFNAFLAASIVLSSCILAFVSIAGTSERYHDQSLASRECIQPSVAHGKISIAGNTQLTAFFVNNTSDGTAGNPHIIQGFEIDAGGVGSAIYIRDTNKHLVIQQCTLSGSVGTPNTNAGISLYNCSNVIIRWNTATLNAGPGFYIDESTNILISSNALTTNSKGGVTFLYSSGVTITNNTISNCGGGIYVQDSGNVSVSMNTIMNIGGTGIGISDCTPPLKITNNTISDCDDDGISIVTMYHAVIANNTITRCDYFGIDIENDCCDNNITHNLVTFCLIGGINFYNGGNNLTGNIIWRNAFLNNTYTESQSWRLTQGDNDWDFGGIGNYWGDYRARYPNATATSNIWSIPYELYALDYDHYPLVSIDLVSTQTPQDTGTMIAIIVVLAFVALSAMVVFKAYKEILIFPKR